VLCAAGLRKHPAQATGNAAVRMSVRNGVRSLIFMSVLVRYEGRPFIAAMSFQISGGSCQLHFVSDWSRRFENLFAN
jgi:hypothetical protein